MATPKPSAKPSKVVVEKGDTLWDIAKDYLGGDGMKYKQLAAINGIRNPDLIFVGQEIELVGSAAASSSGSKTEKNKAVIELFGLLAAAQEDTLFAVWSWGKHDKTEKYEYEWEYTIKGIEDVWWAGDKNSTKEQEHKYAIPNNAELVRFRVKPISKTETYQDKKGKNQTKTHFTANWTAWKAYDTDNLPPIAPSAKPIVKIDDHNKFSATAELSGIVADDLNATHITFQVVQDSYCELMSSSLIAIPDPGSPSAGKVSFTIPKLRPGAEYKIRCRSIRGNQVSDWGQFSESFYTPPTKPLGFTECRANSSATTGAISVYFAWNKVNSAKQYEIEYATSLDHFDGTDMTTTITVPKEYQDHYESYGLYAGDNGATYYFRLRAINDAGESEWSDISALALGKPPDAPTTWSSTATAIIERPLYLYWVHNSKDGSSETRALVEMGLYRNVGGNYEHIVTGTTTVLKSTSVDEKDKTSSMDVTPNIKAGLNSIGKPEIYESGVQLRWRVKTSGVTEKFGDWSVMRSIDIYAEPSITLVLQDDAVNLEGPTDIIESFPIYISASTSPKTQRPIGFHLTITANSGYETVDSVGNDKLVSAGDIVYSRHIERPSNTDLVGDDIVTLLPSDVDLESGVSYTLSCMAAMDSGLTAEASATFTVNWQDEAHMPNATIQYDPSTVVTQIRPYCESREITYKGVTVSDGIYISSSETVSVIPGSPLELMYTATGYRVYSEQTANGTVTYYYMRGGSKVTVKESQIAKRERAYTTSGDLVYLGSTSISIDADGNVSGGEEVYYYEHITSTLIPDVTLAVYRREFDGSYTEIGSNIDNTKNTYVTDPHPALDYARYRIVATTNSSGAISYYDVPGFPIGEKAVIIQWDEDWSYFDAVGDAIPAEMPWTGSMLRLPYNIDVSDSYSIDSALVEYIGRKHPVSYYGTQTGESSTWSTVIPKEDKETLYALRRLAIWTGDCYVREPSGSGYWANVSVSFNQSHGDLTIPVTLSIKRVEGGV